MKRDEKRSMKLKLKKETVRQLTAGELSAAAGGATGFKCPGHSADCPPPRTMDCPRTQ